MRASLQSIHFLSRKNPPAFRNADGLKIFNLYIMKNSRAKMAG